MEPAIVSRLQAGDILLCDGSFVAMLQDFDWEMGGPPPCLNVEAPDVVERVHRAYLDCNVDVLRTNTHGATRQRLGYFGCARRVAEVNRAAVRIARDVAQRSEKQVMIAGTVGPAAVAATRLSLSRRDRRAALEEQLSALIDAGVDLLWLESFGDLEEVHEAVELAASMTALPIVAQVTIAEDGRTLISWDTPREVARCLCSQPVIAIGFNCMIGPQGMLGPLQELSRETNLPLCALPDTGTPRMMPTGRLRYATDVPYFTGYLKRYIAAGAQLVGGCCGTTAEHIMAARWLLPRGLRRDSLKDKATTDRHSQIIRRRLVHGFRTREGYLTSMPTESLRCGRQRPPEYNGGERPSFLLDLRKGCFHVIAELRAPCGGDIQAALQEARRLRSAGAQAIVVGRSRFDRAQVNPATLAVLLQRTVSIPMIVCMTTWDKSLVALQADLLGLHICGINTLVCRTGRPPLYEIHTGRGDLWQTDSLGLIRLARRLNDGKDYNGMPIDIRTDFIVGARVRADMADVGLELERTRLKIEAGIDFLVTDPVYDIRPVERLLDGLGENIPPLLVGIKPVRELMEVEYLAHEVPEVKLPDELLSRVGSAGTDVKSVGLECARELIDRVRRLSQGVVVHVEDPDDLVMLLEGQNVG